MATGPSSDLIELVDCQLQFDWGHVNPEEDEPVCTSPVSLDTFVDGKMVDGAWLGVNGCQRWKYVLQNRETYFRGKTVVLIGFGILGYIYMHVYIQIYEHMYICSIPVFEGVEYSLLYNTYLYVLHEWIYSFHPQNHGLRHLCFPVRIVGAASNIANMSGEAVITNIVGGFKCPEVLTRRLARGRGGSHLSFGWREILCPARAVFFLGVR